MPTKTDVSFTVEELRATTSRKAQLALACLCVSLSALATVPFFFMGKYPEGKSGPAFRMPTTHDMDRHLNQMRSFYNGLRSGEVYPRWEEDTNRGYGAPTTSYYPPGVYYLTSACYAILRDWLCAILATHLILMVASAAAIYLYARQAMSRLAAVVAMSAYIFLPYHLIDQYQRGALAELTGFSMMPLLLMFGGRLFDEPSLVDERASGQVSAKLLNAAALAACYAAFVWSHPPTAYQFTLAFGVFALLFAWKSRDLKGLLVLGGAMALGLALSAYYLYPAVVEQDLIRHYVEQSWPYHYSYVFVYSEPYRTTYRGFFALIDGTWIFNAVLTVVAALALLLESKALKLNARLGQCILSWLVMGCFASFMMTKLSYPLGRMMPKIDIGVFSWRMLSITTLMLALLAGACAQAAFDARKLRCRSAQATFVSLASFIAVGGVIVSVAAVAGPMATTPVLVRSAEHLDASTVPITAPENIKDLTERQRAELKGGRGQISIERWDPEHRALRVELSAPDRLSVRTFNFPGWTATVDGRRAEILTGEQTGEIVLDLTSGSHRIELDYLDTAARHAGRLITTFSFLLLTGMVIISLAMRER